MSDARWRNLLRLSQPQRQPAGHYGGGRRVGHWHYTYYYYTQAMYRMGGRDSKGKKDWEDFRDRLYRRILGEQTSNGSWTGYIGPIYVTSLNLTMLQLENAYLPIFQK